MDKIKYKDIFRKLINMKHGMVIDFNSIEQKLKYLREGGPLTYDDLDVIADDNCWPFKKYWMWPCREQIDDKLIKTNNCFMDLPDNEEKIIDQLLDIFKNISLVSIILRFVCPKFYAIYSRPPLYLLRIERGLNDIDEYINYVNELRILKESFKEDQTAEADMIVWEIAEETQKENRSFNEKKTLEEFIELLAEKLPENLTIGELVYHHSQEPLKIAEIYFKRKDYKTAGMWAGRAFEKYIFEECRRSRIYIPKTKGDKLITLVKKLCQYDNFWYRKDTLHRLRKLRNRAMHIEDPCTKEEAKFLIEEMKMLEVN